MKKLYIFMLLVMAGIMSNAQTSIWDGNRKLWTQGEGTENSPYLIESSENLAFLSYMVNKGFETQGLHFLLTTDIDLNGNKDLPWIPIGLGSDWFYEDNCPRKIPSYLDSNINNSFRGHFDGGGHSIFNIYVDGSYVGGLFGTAGTGSLIENISIESGYIHDAGYGGGIVGKCNSDVVISHCTNHADISGEYVGGIVGNGATLVDKCVNTGLIKGSTAAGGIAGFLVSEISECYNTGRVISYGNGGGIMGYTLKNITIVNCYNMGNVSGNAQYIGGIGGVVNKGLVKNCYSVGNVSNGQGMVAGIIASSFSGTADNIYYLNSCGGEGIGVSMTAEAMRDESFVNILNNDTDVWHYDINNANDGYPILANSLSTNEMAVSMLCVYPNPAMGSFTVEGTGFLTITNILGQTVTKQAIENRAVVSLSEGIYLLRLTNGNNAVTKKVIVY